MTFVQLFCPGVYISANIVYKGVSVIYFSLDLSLPKLTYYVANCPFFLYYIIVSLYYQI